MGMDPDNELYDSACELLAAAQRLQRAAACGEDVARALPATLGCLEATLAALRKATVTLRQDADAADELGALGDALGDAERAAERARAAGARSLQASA